MRSPSGGCLVRPRQLPHQFLPGECDKDPIMDRRTFAILASAFALCGTRKLSASSVSPATPPEQNNAIPDQPSPTVPEPERFPVLTEEYKTLDPEFLPQLV